MFLARQVIEHVYEKRDGKGILLAFDWAKCFDTISMPGLLIALRRFGLPQHFVDVVADIYRDRVFVVREGRHESAQHKQSSGILQGCPLSPFLFSILMTLLIRDARAKLETRIGQPYVCALGAERSCMPMIRCS